MVTDVRDDPQLGFSEEALPPELGDPIEQLLGAYRDNLGTTQTPEGQDVLKADRTAKKIRRMIKDKLPLDGHEHRYRVGDCVISVGTEIPGGPVNPRGPHQRIKIEIEL